MPHTSVMAVINTIIKDKDKALTKVNKKINDLEEKLINGVVENST